MSVQEMTERFDWSDEEARLRKALCEIGSLCYQRNYIVGADGNLSARRSDGTMLITPKGAMKGFLSPRSLAHVDMRGEPVDDGPQCSSEVGIHIVSYEERPEMKAVLHCNPPHCVAMTVAEIDLQVPIIPEIVVTIGGILGTVARVNKDTEEVTLILDESNNTRMKIVRSAIRQIIVDEDPKKPIS